MHICSQSNRTTDQVVKKLATCLMQEDPGVPLTHASTCTLILLMSIVHLIDLGIPPSSIIVLIAPWFVCYCVTV